MDGSSIDCGPSRPSKATPNRTNTRVPKEVFHALSRFPYAFPAPPLPARCSSPAASQALAEETSPCFTGDGTIKEVLDVLRRLYRLGLDRQGQADHRAQRPRHGLLRHPRSRRGHRRDGRSGEDRRDQAQLLFHARRGLRGQEGLRQGHRRSRRGHQARCRPRRLFPAARHRLSRQGRSRPGACRVQREGQARSRRRRAASPSAAISTACARSTIFPSPTTTR